ncbi:MAG TPA: TraB/GumN family protein [Chthoniobacterales bacterium]|nr:TraB/GumN family protein [Chthoniobacterales bacterium]
MIFFLRRSFCISVAAVAAFLSLTSTQAAPVYQVTSPNGQRHFLGGSVHSLRGTDYPLPPAFSRAFDASSRLIFEAEPKDLSRSAANFLKAGHYPKGDSLKNHVDPRTYEYVGRIFRLLHVPEAEFSKYRPWLLAFQLQALGAQGRAELGVEGFLTQRARANSKPIFGLETLRDGVATFADLSERQAEAFLLLTFLPSANPQVGNAELLAAWRRGETDYVWRITHDGFRDYPELGRRVLEDRNRTWMPKIERYFANSTPSFVVVGAAHLGGPEGLLRQLRSKGYKIELL